MGRALELLRDYGYLFVFLGSVIDQSGIPLFIVAGGILVAAGMLKVLPVILLSLLALVSTDILFVFLGEYLSNILRGNYSQRKATIWLKRFLISGTEVFFTSPNLFYLFSKVVPVIGKYVPIFTGFSSSQRVRAIALFTVGDIIYAIVFLFGGIFLGDLFMKHSKILAIGTTAIFLSVFFIVRALVKKRIEKIAK